FAGHRHPLSQWIRIWDCPSTPGMERRLQLVFGPIRKRSGEQLWHIHRRPNSISQGHEEISNRGTHADSNKRPVCHPAGLRLPTYTQRQSERKLERVDFVWRQAAVL